MTYLLKYDIDLEVGVFTPETLGDAGGADALLFGSLLFLDDGGVSCAWYTRDGRTGDELSPTDMFKAWAFLAYGLSLALPLGSEPHRIATAAHEAVKAMVMAGKQEP